MTIITYVMLFFAVLGALDRIIGNRFGLGAKFEEGISIIAPCALSMIGMIVLAPVMAGGILSLAGGHDLSILPVMILANDMGGAPLAMELSGGTLIGKFNACIVSSMMGCTISFTLPNIIELVPAEKRPLVFKGILCGIVGMPFGCLAGGLFMGIGIIKLITNLIPLAILAAIICVALIFCPDKCIRVSQIFGKIISITVTIGLIIGIITYLTGKTIIPGTGSFEEAGLIILNAAAVASGAFPMIFILGKLLSKPFSFISDKTGLNNVSVTSFIGTLACSLPTLAAVKNMDDKGIVLNCAFIVPASFVFADHLAFTLAYEPSCTLPMIVGKLSGGLAAIVVAIAMLKAKKS